MFIESNGILYYADYAPCASGCVIIAYDLKKQAQLWRSELKGIGKLAHSLYQNTVRMERFDGTVFAIYGEESFGSYFELVEYATGKTVGHKIFSEKK